MGVRQQRKATWPVVCILGCVFVLCLAAPRAWEQAARKQAIEELLRQNAVADAAAEEAALSALPVQPSPQPPVVPTQAIEDPAETDVARAQEAHPADKIASHPADFDDPSVAVPAIEEDMPLELPQDDRLSAADASEPTPEPAGQVSPPEQGQQPSLALSGPPDVPAKPEPVRVEPAPPVLRRLPDVAVQAADLEPRHEPEPLWKVPDSLRTRLERLGRIPGAKAWAVDMQECLEKLMSALSASEETSAPRMAEIKMRAVGVEKIAGRLEANEAAEMRRAAHAVLRRLELWRQVVALSGPALKPVAMPKPDQERLALCLNNLKGLDGESPISEAWQQYLLVDSLKTLAGSREAAGREDARELARRVLTRITRAPMDERQRALVEGEPMLALRSELERFAAEAVDPAQLLGGVEEFESGGLASDARRVAQQRRRMSFSPVAAERELARRIESYYRNANVRVAFTQTLMNRLTPEPKAECEPVHDTILGYPVRGRSLNCPELSVEFLPDPERLLMAFRVQGWVSSSTSSTAGPATFFDSSHAYYEATKPLEIHADGIHVDPARVSVYSNSRLSGLRTSFDGIPILGGIVQGIARNQHEERKPEATAEVECKISTRAKQRVDEEVTNRLRAGVERMRQRVFAPLNELGLNPVMIESQTTAERMTMRLRLADDAQLGSQTPRPRAPSDSMATVQLHQTALNNMLERMELEGRTFTPEELAKHMATKLHRDTWPCLTERDDVTLRFADKDAMSVGLEDGRLMLTLSIAELRNAPRVWRDFKVRVFFRPVVQGRSAELARDGVVQLIGRMSMTSQIAVRGIFSKTFSKDTTWRIIPDRLAEDPKLADLVVSQFAIEDGWLSMAMSAGRQETALRPAVNRERR